MGLEEAAATAAAAATSSNETGDWEALKELGNQAFKRNALAEAIQHYSAAIEVNPNEPVLFSNRSAAYLKKGQYQQAAEDAETAVKLDSTFTKAYSRLHSALCNLGQFDRAAQVIKAGLVTILSSPKTTPQDIRHLKELIGNAEQASTVVPRARKLIADNSHAEASRALSSLYREFSDCPTLAFLYAEAHTVSSPEEAAEVLRPFAQTHSFDPYYLYLRALVLYYRGQEGVTNAQHLLREALQMDPDNARARILLKRIRAVEAHKDTGNDAFRNKRTREAVEEYTQAIECDVTNARMNATLRSNRAAARMDLGDYKGALLDCDFAINNGSTSAKIYARRSRIQEKLEKFDDAVRDMQHAAEADRQFEGELHQLKVRAKQSTRKDYYKILNLPQHESNQDAIKRAYKKACLQWHPDKWAHTSDEEKQHAEKQFKEVGEAFGVLTDPHKKRLYDSGQIDNDVEGANVGGGFGRGVSGQEDMMNVMNMMFGGGGGTFYTTNFRPAGFPSGFSGMGGAGPRRRPRGAPPGFFQL